ncbi:MAG TPA: GNAT family N-acetyltransferase [Streptosporangiaceae bacterium]|jgi:predicted acetyltransferase
MDAEIRPISDDEVDAFLRVIPSVAGLPMWEPEPAAWWSGPGAGPVFGGTPSDAELKRYRSDLPELDRTQAAFVAGKLAGTSAVLSLELTIPGRGPVPMGGVTAVGVLPTHRRQGLLRGMMRAALDDCRDRGEMLAALSASEAGIYGRFGFGPATFQVRWELDRTRAALARPPENPGQIELVGAAQAMAAWPRLHDRARNARVGEVSAYPRFWEDLAGPENQGHDGSGSKLFVLRSGPDGQADGAAIFRLPWSADPATSGIVQVDWLEATSAAAYTDLWVFLADLDLTRRVVAGKRPVDEPLRWQLADSRALRVTRQADNLWVRLVDVPGALAARGYAMPGSLVLEVTDAFCPWNDGRWRLEAGPDGASCTRVPAGAAPELFLSAATLGSVYLGGVALGPLARAGLVHELVPGALSRATAMLACGEAPHTAIGF